MKINTTISISMNVPEKDIPKLSKIINTIAEDNMCNFISNKYINLIKNTMTPDELNNMQTSAITTILQLQHELIN